jgi:glycosyltransferase involved in cell wall biosynthesis
MVPIVWRTGGIPDVVVDGETGFVVDSVAEMADRLRRVLRDETLRNEMGAAARRQMLDEYGIEAVAERFTSMYSQVIG